MSDTPDLTRLEEIAQLIERIAAKGSVSRFEEPQLERGAAYLCSFCGPIGSTQAAELSAVIAMTQEEIYRLPEYSYSLPTGTTIGKRWRCNRNWNGQPDLTPDWWMGEYVPHEDPKFVGIKWRRIVAVEVPASEEARV